TCQRSSGAAKLMRADREPLPPFQAFVKSAMASDGGRTSRVTVFTVPPRNVGLEGRNQFVRVCEGVVAFLASVVPMVALARVVVVPKNALAANYVSMAILESVVRTRQWCRKLPKHQLGECNLGVDDSSTDELDSLH